MSIRSYRDLRVWQEGMDLVEGVYRVTRCFPREEVFSLTNQMQRAAVSVPSNIAEGHARESTREYLQHLSVAQGSLAELQTQVEIACRLGYMPPSQRAPDKSQRPFPPALRIKKRSLEKTRPIAMKSLTPDS